MRSRFPLEVVIDSFGSFQPCARGTGSARGKVRWQEESRGEERGELEIRSYLIQLELQKNRDSSGAKAPLYPRVFGTAKAVPSYRDAKKGAGAMREEKVGLLRSE